MPLVGGEMGGWPEKWYDQDRYIKCPARGCDHVFKSDVDIKYRWNHWRKSGSRETTTDHKILQAMNLQRLCPYCPYKVNSHKMHSIRDLFQHEAEVHNTDNTTCIEGICTLIRAGVLPNVTEQLQQLVWERMCQIMKTMVEYRVMLGYCSLPPQTTAVNLIKLVSPENLRPGGPQAPFYTPISSDDFLYHLMPDEFNEWDVVWEWQENWNSLRKAYRSGEL